MKLFTKLIAGVFLAAVMISLGACNTLDGAGKDIETAGEAMQDAAD